MRAKRTDETVSGSIRSNFEIAARIRQKTQRGVVALMAVLFLLFMLGVVLLLAHQMAATDVYDSGAQNNSVEALFLAETGVERATSRFATVACNALGEAAILHGRGQFIISNGLSTDFAGAALPANRCRVPVTGEILGALRVGRRIEAIIESGAIAVEAVAFQGNNTSLLTRTIPFTVNGAGRVLVVGITVDTASGSIVSNVTYAGTSLTQRANVGTSPLTDIWTLANPATGLNNVVVTLSGSDQMAVGVVSFTGVDTTTPTSHLDVAPVTAGAGSGTTASVTITPVSNGAWIVDTVSVNNGVVTNMTAMADRLERWNIRMGASATGAGSSLGPVSPAAARVLTWTWAGSRRWSQAAIAFRPAGTSRVIAWRELTN